MSSVSLPQISLIPPIHHWQTCKINVIDEVNNYHTFCPYAILLRYKKQWCKSRWYFCPASMAFLVQTSQTIANEQYSTACVLEACQTQCQGLLPQQTPNCHSNFSPRGLKDSQDTRYSRPIELNLTRNARSLSSINALKLCNVTCHLAPTKMWHPRPRGRGGEVCGGGPCRLLRLCFTLGFTLHVLPITDKGEAVLRSMWFHLEQVKQCRKIDPSSVAFQRPVRNSAKS